MTLLDILTQKHTPMMQATIDAAIIKHGVDAEAVITSGTVSKRKGSNAELAARYVLKTDDFSVYAGPRACRYANDGYRLLIVKGGR